MEVQVDSTNVAEDDHLRCRHMRELIQNNHLKSTVPGPVTIPRVLVQFWHDLTALPEDVRDCLNSWESLTTQGFRRVLFDDSEARIFIRRQLGDLYAAAFDRCCHPAMRCDYFRLCYIFTEGGFYVDADEVYQGGDCSSLYRDNKLKIQPLCYDTDTNSMISSDIFIRRKVQSSNWIFYVNNNPLIAPSQHPVIRHALERSTRILMSQTNNHLDIQSTTGPGNLTTSLVQHSLDSSASKKDQDFSLLYDWGSISICYWPLSYREDARNWRLWNDRF